MSIRTHARQLDLDVRVTLFDIDLSELGGPIYRIAPMSQLLGSSGYTSMKTTATGQRIDYPIDAGNAMTLYVKVVVKGEPSAQNSSIIRAYMSGSQNGWMVIDPSNDQTSVVGKTPAEVTSQRVSTLKYGDYQMTILKVTRTGAQGKFQKVSVIPLYGQLSAFPAVGTVPSQGVLNVVSLEVWSEESFRLQPIPLNTETLIGLIKLEKKLSEEAFRPIRWKGYDYDPVPVEADGFEMASSGAAPRPRMRMNNALGFGTQLVKTHYDLLGAKVTRWRTFARYLDDGPTPDPNAFLPPDVYYVDLKSSHTNEVVEWELSSVLDQQGVMLPARQVMRYGCQLQYRVWTGTTFSYENVTCPYVGTQYFDDKDDPTTPNKDKCSHTLNGCKKRFPSGTIPFGGFPMVGRLGR